MRWAERERGDGPSHACLKSTDVRPRLPSGAWGLVENRAALLRRRRAYGARRAVVGTSRYFRVSCLHGDRIRPPRGPGTGGHTGAHFMWLYFGHSGLR